jgi:hypothetical protein
MSQRTDAFYKSKFAEWLINGCLEARKKNVVQLGTSLVIDASKVPALPEGWTVKRSDSIVFMAVSPDGKEYLIGLGKLYPWLSRPTGKKYINVSEAIDIPKGKA